MTTVTQTEFARMEKKARSYITALKNAGRLVMTDDGKVDVEASREKIYGTADPSRDDVKKRWEEQRPQSTAVDSEPEEKSGSYQASRALKENYNARLAKLEYEERCKKLIPTSEVIAVVSNAAVTLRTRLESFPDLLAPQLASISDEQQIRAMLADNIEMLLGELSAQMATIGKAE